MRLIDAIQGSDYIFVNITCESRLQAYMRSWGIYVGQKFKLISTLNNVYIILVGNSRYSIDENLAKQIEITNEM